MPVSTAGRNARGSGVSARRRSNLPDILRVTSCCSQETSFAAFDGVSLEPLDTRGMLVDMNGNGARGALA